MAKTSQKFPPMQPGPAPDPYLAPMSGITDAPFRDAVRAFGLGVLVSEMVASRAMMQTLRDTRKLRHVFDPQRPTVLQLAGTDPALIAQAVEIAQDRGALAIDLNFGCPARKVTGKAAGSALMQYPDLCRQIFAAVGQVARVPWSVKMRLGWDSGSLNAADLAADAVQAGAGLIAVHGRTRCQFYKGAADWTAVGQIVRAVHVPVVVNGDIGCADSAGSALKASGAATYMVGRAMTGLPWRLRQIEMQRRGQPWHLSLPDQTQVQAQLLEGLLSHYGRALGLKSYRKHLSAWLTALGWQSEKRRDPLTIEDPEGLFALLRRIDSLDQSNLRAAA